MPMLYPQDNRFRETKELSGFWDFRLDPAERGVEQGWHDGFAPQRHIAVPCSWNEQFQDLKNYFGRAWYQARFHLPRGWQGRRVWLRVGSANYWADVWLNGERAGGHAGGHLPFEFDVTRLVRPEDENVLVIRVNGELSLETVPWGMVPDPHLPRSAEQYPDINFDFFPYCGLHRPVILYTTPPAAIRDLSVHTTLNEPGASLHVAVRADLPEGARIPCALYPAGEGTAVVTGEATWATDGSFHCQLAVPDPRLWGPADPYLYTLHLDMIQDGQTCDEYQLPVGLRTVAVQGDQLLLNDRPIFLQGFGKHEDFPVVGRGFCLPVAVKDFALLRWIGANSFRTAHYPHAEQVLQMADRQGLMVIAESPAVSLFFGRGTRQRLAVCKQQVEEMIARDRNHPSVIMWSVANEPDSDVPQAVPFLKELADLCHKLDNTRPVTFASHKGVADEAIRYFDVMCLNRYYGWYSDPAQLELACQKLGDEMDAMHQKFGKPLLLTEFGADALAGRHTDPPELFGEEFQVELVRRYLEVVRRKPYAVGAHVWTFADFRTAQTFRRVTGVNYKGAFTRDRQPKMAAHMLRSLWHTEGPGGEREQE
jgi:beta-glucuronidase